MKILGVLTRGFIFTRRDALVSAPCRIFSNQFFRRGFSADSGDPELKEFMDYMDNLKNFEKSGVPKGAGTDSKDGFDLGRMRRLMELLGNPQSRFKAVHVAGTKGKGSTAAFISNILRAEGYLVGCYTSPHIQTIRERISVGRSGKPVSVKALNYLFQRIKKVLDQAVELENGCLSHFEVFTAIAFSLFAQENVDIAIIEVVLGGPFLPHIEHILRDKASSMSASVVSASDPGNRSKIKGLCNLYGKPGQVCDIVIQIEKDLQLFIELFDVKLSMLGSHQLQNAATATCAALCLRYQGLKISDGSILIGLENTYLLGRSQFLTSREAEALGLPGATILLDGAHTKESAKALADTIQMIVPKAKLILVVAMASDKDHLGFARELLSVKNLEAIFLTEVEIAGDKSRMTSTALLKDCWIKASEEIGATLLDYGVADMEKLLQQSVVHSAGGPDHQPILTIETSVVASMRAGDGILRAKAGNQSGNYELR